MEAKANGLKLKIKKLENQSEIDRNELLLLAKEIARNMISGVHQESSSGSVQTAMERVGSTSATSQSDQIVDGMSFIEFIEHLSHLLTNESHLKRSDGIFLLIHCLLFLLEDKSSHNQIANSGFTASRLLNHQSITVLFDFMLSRLDDHASVDDLLSGLVALLEKNLLAKSDQLEIIPKIMKEINVQNYPQNARYNIFQIFSLVLKNNTTHINAAPLDFISSFIHSMDGEKDPRNLLLLFQIAHSIVENLDFSGKCQDLFEVVYCYFPITFRPPQNDVYQITADDLKLALRNVVSSTSLFATFAIPVLMEKVTSSSLSAKKDAIETISACLPAYTAQPFIPHLNEFWKVVKTEIANSPDTDIELSCLKCLRDMAKALSLAIVISCDPKTPLSKFLNSTLSECISYFKGSDPRYIKPCGKIAASLASSSVAAANECAEKVFPILFEEYESKKASPDKHSILNILVDMILSTRLVFSADCGKGKKNIFAEREKGKTVELLVTVVLSETYVPLIQTAIRGIYELLSFESLLNESEVELCCSHLHYCALKVNESQVAIEAQSGLKRLSFQQPNLILTFSIPFLMKSLEESKDEVLVQHCLDSLVAIGKSKETFEEVMDVFYSYLSHLTIPSHILPRVLKSCLDCFRGVESQEKSRLAGKQWNHLYQVLQNNYILEQMESKSELRNLISNMLYLNIRSMEYPLQSQLLEALSTQQGKTFIPQSVVSALLLQSQLCNAKREVKAVSIYATPSFIIDLISFYFSHLDGSNRVFFRLIVCTILGSLVNKNLSHEDCQKVIDWVKIDLVDKALLNGVNISTEKKFDIIMIYAWIAKGLVVKADPKGFEMVSFLISLLEDDQLADQASQAMEVVIKDDADGYLTRESFSNVKLLFKQRLYHYSAPLLVKGFENSNSAKKNHFLMALSHLLLNVSKKTLMNELESLFPMLLYALQSTDSNLKQATLETFMFMIQEAPHLVSTHFTTILHSLMKLFSLNGKEEIQQTGNDVRVRVMAIRLVGSFPGKIEFSILSIYKVSVLAALEKSLNDHKRLVRKEAAVARGKWFMMTGVDNTS